MTLEELAKKVQVLEDVEAIKKLKCQYAQACDDNYNPEKIAELFTEDGVWDGGEVWGVHHGKRKIKGYFAQVSKDVTLAVHYVIAPDITVKGDKAQGQWYGLVPATFHGKAIWMSVFYNDEYVKMDGKWLAKYMKVSCFFLTPYEEGWAKQRLLDWREKS